MVIRGQCGIELAEEKSDNEENNIDILQTKK